MIGVLVKRSLFMELIRGSVQLHDIVRDYTLGKLEEERKTTHTGGLELLQRSFVSEFLASQEEWEGVAGGTIPRGKELDWYLCTDALGWHMKGAWSQPLIKDDEACSWLQHASSQVVASAVKAIPLQEQLVLAEQLADTDDLEQAARVLVKLIEVCELSVPEVQAHTTRVFEFVDRVPVEARSMKLTKYEVTSANTLVYTSKMGSAEWELGVGRLMQLADRGAKLGHSAM
jgi:hypothetical protein